MKSEGTEIKIKSLQKALQVLECFVEKQPLGVTEISEKMGLYKSNVHNILSTFKAMDYLEQDPDSGKFRLGTAVFSLSRALRENLDISRIAVPFMRRIAEEVGEVVYLTIPRGEEVVYLEAVYPESQKLPGSIVTGERAKMHCTSVGKAILSSMDKSERDELLKEPLEAFTENTITDRQELEEELKITAARKYGLDDMELMFGIKCGGVALLNHEGKPEGGLSISAPSLRMSEEKILIFAEILNRYKQEIQKRL